MAIGQRVDVRCAECGQLIHSEEDLITSLRAFAIKPFHAACYARGIKKRWLYVDPINTGPFKIMAYLLAAIGALIFIGYSATVTVYLSMSASTPAMLIIMGPMGVLCALFFVPLVLKHQSWKQFEKHFEE